jgi:hypothetical protein
MKMKGGSYSKNRIQQTKALIKEQVNRHAL